MTNVKKVKLYRFERFDTKRLQAIRLKKLWFASPNKFNDLNDCHLNISKMTDDFFSEDDLFSAADILYKNIENSNTHPVDNKVLMLLFRKYNFETLNGETVFEKFIDILKQGSEIVVPYAIEEMLRLEIKKTTGVCCFFGVAPENQLMWAHYADNHQGFCTEYIIEIPEKLPTIGPYSINYTSDWPVKIHEKELIFSPVSTINRVVTTKGIDWAHEKEYRFIKLGMLDPQKNEFGKKIDLPSGLNAHRIIAGERVEGNQLEQLKQLASDLNLEFTRMTRQSFS
jgi:hypothetical protein